MAKIAIQGNPAGTGTITFQPPNTNTNRTVSLPDVDGTMAVAEQASVPIGSLLWVTGTSAPAGYVAANGQLLDRATYPALWTYANGSGNIVADVSWTKGNYSSGDGSTSFRVPDLRDQFIRGSSGSRVVGFGEEDALQNHTHEVLSSNVYSLGDGSAINGSTSGFAGRGAPTGYYNTNSNGIQLLNGPTVNTLNGGGTPRTADENRPVNISYLPCIRAYDILSNPELLNAAEIVSQVNSLEVAKLNKDDNIVLGASVTASGTAVDFVGIPEGVKRITVMFDGVSTNGTSGVILQIGDGAIQTTNYKGGGLNVGTTTQPQLNSNGFLTQGLTGDVVIREGIGVLTCSMLNQWAFLSSMGRSDVANMFFGSGLKPLSNTLDRIRITTLNGTDQFNAGTINISWEF